QHGEVLGGVGLLDAHLRAELAHRQLAVAQELHDGDPRRAAEGLKNAGLELPHRVQHAAGPRRHRPSRASTSIRIVEYRKRSKPGRGEKADYTPNRRNASRFSWIPSPGCVGTVR